MKICILPWLLALLCAGCTKQADLFIANPINQKASLLSTPQQAVVYTIAKGNHYCDKNTFQVTDTTELKFSVRFDSSAVYKTFDPKNQYDINKLYGFSDNGMQHHQFSARFGWRWSHGALRLFAYVYNKGVRAEKELATIGIGEIAKCSIRIAGDSYVFVLNGASTTMPRESTTPKGKGYLLYPYFGGDEVAPHDIKIEIGKG